MLRVVLCLALVGAAACGGCRNDPPPPGDVGHDTAADAATDAPATICEPDEVVACREENTPAIDRCSPDGTTVLEASCPNDPPHVCRDDECVEVTCIPGGRRCLDERSPQVCNDDGSAWEDLDECGGSSRCEAGNCLNRCELAELTSSYIGCEYWAVELDNQLLNEAGVLSEEERPPYAIVLANTSTEFDAQVTVWADDGVVAEADAERLVGADIQFPGDDLVTVRSELVDHDGVKLLDIAGPVERVPLPRRSMMTLVFPPRPVPFGASTVRRIGYKVESTQPIVAYQFNPLCCNYSFTNDASLLLPTSALTENYSFLSYEVWKPQFGATAYSSTMTVVATRPDTEITVQLRPSRQTGIDYSDIIYPVEGAEISGPDEQGRMTATLQPFDVLNIAAKEVNEDLTGARITATEPVAVFGGHTCAYVPDGNAACDHLEQQLFPVETWGQRFIAAPLKLRGELAGGARTLEGTYFKILALEDDTTVRTGIDIDFQTNNDVLRQTSGATIPCRDFSEDPALGEFTLDAGESCVIGSKTTFVIEGGRPLMVGAFLSGQGSVEENPQFGDHNGDPAFFLVPPEEQYRSDYSFLTPPTYFVSYVTLLIRPGFTVSLDGQELDLTQFDYELLEDRNIARAHIPLEPGPHFLESQNQIPFGIVVYGYDDYVSYAYTGGLDLTKLNEVP